LWRFIRDILANKLRACLYLPGGIGKQDLLSLTVTRISGHRSLPSGLTTSHGETGGVERILLFLNWSVEEGRRSG